MFDNRTCDFIGNLYQILNEYNPGEIYSSRRYEQGESTEKCPPWVRIMVWYMSGKQSYIFSSALKHDRGVNINLKWWFTWWLMIYWKIRRK